MSDVVSFKRPTAPEPAREGLLQVIRAGASVVAAALSPAARPNRARLRQAIAARDAAQQSVIEARETLERLQAIVDQADDAARASAKATQRANQFRNDWVRGGCKHSDSHELKVLASAAADESKAAQAAAIDANAVRKELARAQGEIQLRQSEVGEREEEIAAAINEILVAESWSLLEHFEAIAQQYRDVRARVVCLKTLLKIKEYSERHAANQRIVDGVLDRCMIVAWDRERENPRARDHLNRTHDEQDWLDGLTRPWLERAAQLRADPES
jgi:hypothetical protein